MTRMPFLLFMLLSFLPFLWLHGGAVYVPESYAFVDPASVLDHYAGAWCTALAYGEPAAPWNQGVLFPAGLIMSLVRRFGGADDLGQKIYVCLYLGGFFAAWWSFAGILTRNIAARTVCVLSAFVSFAFLAGFLYHERMFALLLVPALFSLAVRHLREGGLRWMALHFLTLGLCQAFLFNLAQAATTLMAYPAALLFHGIEQRLPARAWRTAAGKMLLFLLPAVPALMTGWLVYRESMFAAKELFLNLPGNSYTHSPLSMVLQGRGAWWEGSSHLGVPYLHLAPFFDHPVVVAATLMLVVAALLPWTRSGFRDRNGSNRAFFLLLLYLAALAAASGVLFPTAIQQRIPALKAFREPWYKFLPWVVLAQAGLLTLAVERLGKRWFTVALILLMAVKGAPWFTDSFLDRGNRIWKKTFVALPSHWLEFRDWAHENRELALLPFPVGQAYSEYRWYEHDFGNAAYPPYRLVGQPRWLRSNRTPIYGNIYDHLCRHYDAVSDEFLEKGDMSFLRLSPVDGLLETRDMVMHDLLSKEQSGARRYFETSPERVFGGQLFLYRVKESCRVPWVYAADREVRLKGGFHDLARFIPPPEKRFRSALFLEGGGDRALLSDRVLASPGVEGERLSSSRWRIRVAGAKGRYILVLNQTHHRGWRLYTEGPGGSKRPIAEGTHERVNGFANAWTVDPAEAGGADHVLIAEYAPARLFLGAWVLQGLTLAGAILVLIPKRKRVTP